MSVEAFVLVVVVAALGAVAAGVYFTSKAGAAQGAICAAAAAGIIALGGIAWATGEILAFCAGILAIDMTHYLDKVRRG